MKRQPSPDAPTPPRGADVQRLQFRGPPAPFIVNHHRNRRAHDTSIVGDDPELSPVRAEVRAGIAHVRLARIIQIQDEAELAIARRDERMDQPLFSGSNGPERAPPVLGWFFHELRAGALRQQVVDQGVECLVEFLVGEVRPLGDLALDPFNNIRAVVWLAPQGVQ